VTEFYKFASENQGLVVVLALIIFGFIGHVVNRLTRRPPAREKTYEERLEDTFGKKGERYG